MATSKALNFGFIFYDFSDSRAQKVIDGLVSQLHNDRLFFFPTGPLNAPSTAEEFAKAKVWQAAKSAPLDGLISLQFWENESWFRQALYDQVDYPIVPLLRSYSEIPGVLVSNEQGSYEAVSHLLQTHQCKKPHYVISSRSVSSALSDRFNGYLRALKDFGIKFDNSMKTEITGGYATSGLITGATHNGDVAVELMFRQRGLMPGRDLDSLVVYNDAMAIEMIESLKKLNIRVPQDIKVISFDNAPEAENAHPPLTSSAVDWSLLGQQSLVMLRRLIQNDPVNTNTCNPSLIVRNSCGCKSPVEQLDPKAIRLMHPRERRQLFKTIQQEFNHHQTQIFASTIQSNYAKATKNTAAILASVTNMQELAQAFTEFLTYFHIEECLINFSADFSSQNLSRSLHWLKTKQQFRYEELTRPSEVKLELNGHYRFQLLESLDVGNKHLGLIIVGTNENTAAPLSNIRDILSDKLNSLLLLENLQLAQEQLIHKEKFASLGLLVSGFAHEMNTPLGTSITAASNLITETQQAMRLFQQGLLSKQAFADTVESFSASSNIIEHNLERANELINNIQRASLAAESMIWQEFNLAEQIQYSIQGMKILLKERQIKVSVDCDDSLTLYNDPFAIGQVLTTLIENSLNHAYQQKTTGRLKITAKLITPNKLRLIFVDDGDGMTPEIAEKIFEPFFTTGRSQGATGLGMFIVFNLVTQNLKGHLQLHSKLGVGTEVEITLPRISGTKKTTA